jgi:hypothetical protein
MVHLNKYFPNVNIKCINLKHRTDKRTYMIKQCKRRKLPIKFYTTELNPNPKRGCLESHIAIIKDAISNGDKVLLALEDDAKILKSLNHIPEPPPDWAMLYLGGTVRSKIERYNQNWFRVTCFTTHAYLLNLENKQLIHDIMQAENSSMEIDNFYIKNIHIKYPCYIVYPMMVLQKDDYSDIEKTYVNYDFMEQTLEGFSKPENAINNGEYTLKLFKCPDEKLPYVSILTPTYNRRRLFQFAIHNWYNLIYPRNKIEWIIVDDSDDGDDSITDLLPRNTNTKYIKLNDRHYTIAEKRNIANNNASHDIRVHMDDDDYYPPVSLQARVKILMKYANDGIECIGCSAIGVYDTVNRKSSISSDGDLTISEASMAYRRSFWKSRGFINTEEKGEYRGFIANRFNKIMDLPYAFIIYALSHDNNFTDKTRRITEDQVIHKKTGNIINFLDTFDEDTQLFINKLFY